MLHVAVTIRGDKEVRQKLTRLGSQLFKLRPEMMQIGSELKRYYSGPVFASQGAVLGTKWRQNAPATRAYKARRYPGTGTKTLVRTGRMQKSFDMTATNTSVTIENTAPYFKYHQSSAPRRKMPYRPMMGVNGDVKSVVRQIIERGVRRKIDGMH